MRFSPSFRLFAVLALAVSMLAAPVVQAEETPVPPRASDDVADEALAQFKADFAAKGRKGDEKIAYQDFALDNLSKVNHPKVVATLAKQTRHRTPEVRTAAVLYLGRQRALPGYAGDAVVKAMDKHRKDPVIVMAGLEALQQLKYRASNELLLALMKHKDFSIQKHALLTIAEMKDVRLLDEVFKLLKDIKKSQGDSWDGVSVTYDTGTAGDGDQKMAEKIGKAQLDKNKAKAKRGRKVSRDIRPLVEKALHALTGEEFSKAEDFKTWRKENEKQIAETVAKLDETAKAHIAEAKRKGKLPKK